MISKDKKYRTLNGREVRIYATDGYHHRPVHGAVLSRKGHWVAEQWHGNGNYGSQPHSLDLIEVQTAEDVVRRALDHWHFRTDANKGRPEQELCQALRDAGKLRDGE